MDHVKDQIPSIAIPLLELAELVQGDIEGDPTVLITGVRGIKEARKGDITFLANEKYLPELEHTQASAVVVSRELDGAPIPMIRVKDPDHSFARIANYVLNKPIVIEKGVHPTAVIGKSVRIGANVSIMAHAVVMDHATIGDNTVVYPQSYIGHYSVLGESCLIYPCVVIRERTVIGNRVILHPGCVIGSDGFGYATLKGVHHKIPQIGIVELEDDVEIGANATIDRARFDKTLIRKGTKIDNLVQIAHNVQIGENCFLISQSGVAGSARIGNNVTIAGKSGINGHIQVGDNSMIGAMSGVTGSLPPGSRVSGYPSMPHEKWLRLAVSLRNLPDLLKQINELQDRVEQLEAQAKNNSQAG